jgi:hypothetical protein
MPTKSVQERLVRYLEVEEQTLDVAFKAVFANLPRWVPLPSREHARRIVQRLISDGFSTNDIRRSIRDAQKDGLIIPGIVTDPVAFTQYIYELAHLRYAVSLGEVEGLRILAGVQAAQGVRFTEGRKSGTTGPIRKLIKNLLARDPSLTNFDLWNLVGSRPPAGWEVHSTPKLGRYFDGPNGRCMSYRRFLNVCAEERKALRSRITG